jgi:hypothetical protein
MLVFRHYPNVTPSHQSFFIDKICPKGFFKFQNSKKSDSGGFESPKVRGGNNKNRQTSIFKFQCIAKSREGLLTNIWFMVIFGYIFQGMIIFPHLPTDHHHFG